MPGERFEAFIDHLDKCDQCNTALALMDFDTPLCCVGQFILDRVDYAMDSCDPQKQNQ